MITVEQLKIVFDNNYTKFDDEEANLLLQLIYLLTQNKQSEFIPNEEKLCSTLES